MLTKVDQPPAEGSFCDENKMALKPPTVERYKKRTSYFNQNNQMANSYLTTSPTFNRAHSFVPHAKPYNTKQMDSVFM
jgi:hypothetical protein